MLSRCEAALGWTALHAARCETCGGAEQARPRQLPVTTHEKAMLAPPDAPTATDDDEEGQITTSVMLIASGYTTRADGQMDFAGFTALVGDLLCLRDDVPHAAPERTQQVAIALAAHVRMVDGQQSQTIDLMLIVDLVLRWA